jgi:hypothetical protein
MSRLPLTVFMLAVVALLIAAAAPAPDATQPTLTADSEARWVPFELTPGNQIRFRLDIDGQPATAILDTGVTRSVMARSYAIAHGLTIARRGPVSAIGGDVATGWVATQTLTMGGLQRSGGGLMVVALPANATGGSDPINILVGQDLIAGFALDIDYAGSRFRLLRSGRIPFRGVSAPLRTVEGIDASVTETRIGTQRQRPTMIDTGDGASVTFARESWAASAAPPGVTTTAIAYGLAGPLITDLTIAPELSIGELTARQVEIRIEPRGGYSRKIGVAGRIGNGLLSRYRVLIDPRAGHAIFAPTSATDKAPMKSTSGLQTATEPTQLRVLHVMRGSPAEAGGWRAGDAICSVDAEAIGAGYDQSKLANWSIGTPGRTVTLGLCDGTARMLTLREFY